MGILKGKTAINIFAKKRHLKEKPYWGNHFWVRGCFVATVGIYEEVFKRSVKYQEEQQESDNEQFKLF